jgi:organic radical activating enzyme
MKKLYPVIPLLEQKSNFFCSAKWTELFLYLNHGLSNSCHHPIPHSIPSELLSDPYVLHNTPHKLQMQELMMQGQRPEECHMCWHIEDSDPDVVSDRIIKSQTWKDEIPNLKPDVHYVPKLIEVVFDNYCNLKCSYCDSGQSSNWAAKVLQHPLHLETDYRKLYSEVSIKPGSTKKEYFDAWMTWWPEIKDQVKMLRISGGEPLLSKNFWKFLEQMQLPADCLLSINSNFSVDTVLIDKFVDHTRNYKAVSVAVSVDATHKIGEYARQGLDFELLTSNIDRFFTVANDTKFKIYLQSTINIFSVWGLVDKLNFHLKLKTKYPQQILDLYSTIVRFPEFQNVLLLPEHITDYLADQINTWAQEHDSELTVQEKSAVNKIATYLKQRPDPFKNISLDLLQADFKKFLVYYNNSSKHDYKDVFPPMFLDWISTIK